MRNSFFGAVKINYSFMTFMHLFPNLCVPRCITKISYEAWEKLQKLFANRSRTRIMHLKERLTLITRGSKPVSKYLQTIKGLVDDLALAGFPQSDDDLIIYTLNGLDLNLKALML